MGGAAVAAIIVRLALASKRRRVIVVFSFMADPPLEIGRSVADRARALPASASGKAQRNIAGVFCHSPGRASSARSPPIGAVPRVRTPEYTAASSTTIDRPSPDP